MLFQTGTFFVFFLVVLGLILLVRSRMGQVLILLLASYVFYMSWNWYLIGLIIGSTVTDYYAALGVYKARSVGVRRSWLMLSLVVNLGLLGFFKYYNFFAASIRATLGFDVPHLDIILPVGISFYTFQTLSYTIDVYLGRHAPTARFMDFALFVAFFPQLVAGPIVRSEQFLPQLDEPLTLKPDHLRSGYNLFMVGLVKKVAIADNLSPFVDRIFESPQDLPSALIVLGALSFGMQIYCDFSGYTDMARGVARIMGIDIPINFNYPYSSRSFGEFWRRWHISLSTWLRDYLYIPLGGNRIGAGRTYFNLMTTMVLGGLWHGAAWNFVVWGAYQGVLLCVGRVLGQTVGVTSWWQRWRGRRVVVVVQWAVVQYFVFLGWLIFRVRGADDLWYCMKKYVLFDGRLSVSQFGVGSANPFTAMIVLAGGLAIHAWSWRCGGLAQVLNRRSLTALVPIHFLVWLLLILLWPSSVAAFIYFQF